jgi:uncharacterized protein YndB with AHSA1/START domain
MPREFELSRELNLPADPEAVWEAVATSAGNAAWMFPNEIDPSAASTKAWDPPHHLSVRMEQPDWFNALEFVIEGREGGTSLLRYAHSGIFVEDWDTQFDAVQRHTDFYLHTLSEYLQHFQGRPVTYIGDVPGGIQGPPASATPDGFERLEHALGIEDGAKEGDSVRMSPEGIEGVIDYRRPIFLGVRTNDALYRFFGRNAFGAPVGMSIHMFGDGVDAESTKEQWQHWLDSALA